MACEWPGTRHTCLPLPKRRSFLSALRVVWSFLHGVGACTCCCGTVSGQSVLHGRVAVKHNMAQHVCIFILAGLFSRKGGSANGLYHVWCQLSGLCVCRAGSWLVHGSCRSNQVLATPCVQGGPLGLPVVELGGPDTPPHQPTLSAR